LKGAGKRRSVAFALIVVFVVSASAVISVYSARKSENQTATSTSSEAATGTSSSGISSDYRNNQPYLNASKVYASLGYPKITYDDFETPYLPSKPNFTLEYDTKDIGRFHVGAINAPALSLNEATRLAADYAHLDPSNYTLGQAVFVPGTVFNSTLIAGPEWFFYFAAIHDGYWIYDNYGPQWLSVEIAVDAANGAVRHLERDQLNLSNSGQYELGINSSRALESVRASNLTGVPVSLTKNGTVRFMEPRVVIPAQSRSTTWLDTYVSGSKLLWIIELDYLNQQGVFAVDAVTGNLVAGSSGISIGMQLSGAYYGSVALSTAKNLTVSTQTFKTNGSTIGKSGSVGVEVPNVLTVKPGSSASIQLNYTAFEIVNPSNVTLSLANPLPGIQGFSSEALPPGVSIQLSKPTIALFGNSTVYATLLISVDRNAPAGTYLIEVGSKYSMPGSEAGTRVLFFLSVWNGGGEWPPPPMIK
jgi:hypothetical protein